MRAWLLSWLLLMVVGGCDGLVTLYDLGAESHDAAAVAPGCSDGKTFNAWLQIQHPGSMVRASTCSGSHLLLVAQSGLSLTLYVVTGANTTGIPSQSFPLGWPASPSSQIFMTISQSYLYVMQAPLNCSVNADPYVAFDLNQNSISMVEQSDDSLSGFSHLVYTAVGISAPFTEPAAPDGGNTDLRVEEQGVLLTICYCMRGEVAPPPEFCQQTVTIRLS